MQNRETEMSRRSFLGKTGGLAVLVVAGGVTTVFADSKQSEQIKKNPQAYDWSQHDYVYLVDTDKCIGCGSCVRACQKENHVPPHRFRTWVERYVVSHDGHTHIDSPDGARNGFPPVVSDYNVAKAFFVPKLCNHCTHTPCVQVCPVGASYRTKDGLILVDEKRCIGCGYCVQACPYGSRFIHPELHVASKCTLCYHRITKGMLPACVQSCPVQARMLGDRKKNGDKVAEIIATSKVVRVLKPELLTEPNCYYKNLSKEVY